MPTEQTRYIQKNILGKGGYGTVYKAWDKQLERDVAIKLFHKHQAKITQEARTLAQVNSPNVVTIYDILDWDGQQAMVMEYVDNALPLTFETLKHFNHEDFVSFLLSAAQGIKAIHEAGIIHGDIKLSNMLMESSKQVKLTDFGLARAGQDTANDSSSEHSSDSQVSGTWECLSPEQIKGENVSDKTDVFALGIILFSTIYGRHPYIENNDLVEARKRLNREINFSEFLLLDERYRAFESLCQAMLQRKPDKRPSIHQVVDILLQSQQQLSSGHADTLTETIDIEVSSKKRPLLYLLPAALLVFIAIFAYYWSPQQEVKTLVIPALVVNQTDDLSADSSQFDVSLLEKSKELSVILNDELMQSVLSASGRMLVPNREWRGERHWPEVAEKLVVDEILFSEVHCSNNLACDVKIALFSKQERKVIKTEELSVPTDNLLVFAELVHSLSNKIIGNENKEHAALNLDEASLKKYAYFRAHIEQLPVDEIITGLKELSRNNPDFTGSTLQLGKVYLQQYDATQDDTWLKKTKEVADRISDSSSGQELLFWYYLEANQFENALSVLERLRQLPNIDYSYLVLRHTMLLFEQGKEAEAVQYLDGHSNIRKTGSYYHLKSYMLEVLGQYQNLLDVVELWLVMDASNIIAREYQLIAYIHLGNMEQAAQLGKSFVGQQVTDDIRYNLSVAYLLSGQYNKSIEELQKLRQSNPQDRRVLINLAEAQKSAGNLEESNRLYQAYVEEIMELETIQWKEMAYLAMAYAHLGQTSNALLALQDMSAKASVDKVSDSSSYYLLSSQIYALLGQQEAAFVNAEKALKSGVGLHWYNFPWLKSLKEKLEKAALTTA
ncbi:serine/threonine-protein kinase [Pleionea sp. CnH1-48]|uniref:serine/threonine-protein kinase n=1 Tax=Pleionea sp. CnH1-48 TaxID=2954494 RepID=UPI0020982C05|nr:serine/threonine-protein kinase [Pleionea sp. CnH1-48]MCO7225587.1 protein kinase [Pleionea sp. CnH1-48]